MPEVVEIPWSGCHIWMGATDTSGYPVRYSKSRGTFYPIKDIFQEFYGEVEKGNHIRHRCDIRCCINPNHLSQGSVSENAIDRYRRGRSPTKLTFEDVDKIRKDTRKQWEIAKSFGVHQSEISRIKSGKRWNYTKEVPVGG